MNLTRTISLLSAVVLAAGLAGCGETRQRAADWLAPPSAAETTARMQEQARQGNLAQAIEIGEDYVRRHPDTHGELRLELARLQTELGNTDRAVHHLQKAHGPAPEAAPAGQATAATPAAPAAPAAPVSPATPAAPAAPVSHAQVSGATASADGQAVEARAGDVVARVPQ